jgi:hypothetical protein
MPKTKTHIPSIDAVIPKDYPTITRCNTFINNDLVAKEYDDYILGNHGISMGNYNTAIGSNNIAIGSNNIAIGALLDNPNKPQFLLLDLWGNITEIKHNGIKVTQKFINNELIEYQDSIGNYWGIKIGVVNPYKIYIIDIINERTISWHITDGNEHHYSINNSAHWLSVANRIMTTTLSQELVSVAPMSAPTPNLFYFDYVYTETKKETWLQRLIKFVKRKLLNIYD